jgi:two-component system, NtrC family, sensor kinase
VGIPPENLTRIFAHGFTTRAHGHGFGLHSSALSAKELRGSLAAESQGTGTGATFTLELPTTVVIPVNRPSASSAEAA